MINKKEKEIKKLMKKRTLLSMLLMIVMAVSLVGCGDDGKSNDNNGNVADKVQPTTTDTAVNATTGDPVTTNTETEILTSEHVTEEITTSELATEPQKNMFTLLSADGSVVIKEFNVPKGYTVVSDNSSNHIYLIKDDNDCVKIEIYSGLNADALSAEYRKKPASWGSHLSENQIEQKRLDEIDKISKATNIDVKYFNQPLVPNSVFDSGRLIIPSKQFVVNQDPNVNGIDYTTDFANNLNEAEKHYVSVEQYYIKNKDAYYPVNETYTIKVTSVFNEKTFDELYPNYKDYDLGIKLERFGEYYIQRQYDFEKFSEAFAYAN